MFVGRNVRVNKLLIKIILKKTTIKDIKIL